MTWIYFAGENDAGFNGFIRFLLLLAVAIPQQFESTTPSVAQQQECSHNLTEPFLCSSKPNVCIESSEKCNKIIDCPNGEDEIGCGYDNKTNESENSTESDFQCKDKKRFILKARWCDTIADCDDESDETSCFNYPHKPQKCNTETEFNCHSNPPICISLEKLCDGVVDCPNRNDERTKNESKTHCPPQSKNLCRNDNHNNCSHICVNYFGNAQCRCRKGYTGLDHESHLCKDIDECAKTWGICGQKCANFPGTYRCSCRAGYTLDKTNNRSCKANITSPMYLLYNTRQDVRIYSLITAETYIIHLLENEIESIDYSLSEENLRVFLVERHAETSEHNCIVTVNFPLSNIEKANISPGSKRAKISSSKTHSVSNKSETETILEFPKKEKISAISVDSVNDRLYWITEEGIYVMDPQTPQRFTKRFAKFLLGKALVAVPKLNRIYFIDEGESHLCEVDLDVTNYRKVTPVQNAHFIYNLMWDYALDCVVWLDTSRKSIHSYDPLTKSEKRIDLYKIPYVNPFGLAVFNEDFFWTDTFNRSVYSISKYATTIETVPTKKQRLIVTTETVNADVHHLQLVHPYNRPSGVNGPCHPNSCQQLCLPSRKASSILSSIGFKCFCYNSFKLDKITNGCVNISENGGTNVAASNHINSKSARQRKRKSASNSSGNSLATNASIFIASVLTCFLLYLALFACYQWRRRRSLAKNDSLTTKLLTRSAQFSGIHSSKEAGVGNDDIEFLGSSSGGSRGSLDISVVKFFKKENPGRKNSVFYDNPLYDDEIASSTLKCQQEEPTSSSALPIQGKQDYDLQQMCDPNHPDHEHMDYPTSYSPYSMNKKDEIHHPLLN